MITVTTRGRVPALARGFVRDLPVHWALEKAGLSCTTRLIDALAQGGSAHRALQPFGQVPALEEDGVTMFGSGAIVLHVARRSETLLPADEVGRARAIAWMVAALNSVENVVQPLVEIDVFAAGEEWAKARRPKILERARQRLADLAAHLGRARASGRSVHRRRSRDDERSAALEEHARARRRAQPCSLCRAVRGAARFPAGDARPPRRLRDGTSMSGPKAPPAMIVTASRPEARVHAVTLHPVCAGAARSIALY
ncbi:glutathione S-transferase family protein [Geminicoccaceae bacterium 1502E]|nr:glutathione S-transferase family protein [Geminicoccaceae bacterium 1502E]